MKLMFASDIHGAASCCKKMLAAFRRERADKLILLGDLLYHGPRNDLPRDYAPKEVISLLNGAKQSLLCVRGNCEAEVDQTVLEFPVMADHLLLWLDGHTALCTHGHLLGTQRIPAPAKGDIIVSGHTHIPKAEEKEGIFYINPGSVSIPKEGNPKSYAVYEDGSFMIKTLEGEEFMCVGIKL
ncbi:MAG: phosphodiesterase [Ruminococcus sp.]|nr:phosphodiesterase [Ruminococcus sp.]